MTSPNGRADELHALLAKVSASLPFARAPQLQRLVKYIVDCTSQGRQINAYTVAVEALDRPDSFDPDKDSIVRVELHRLRRALEDYYKTEGRYDSIKIRIPTGTYLAVFEGASPEPETVRANFRRSLHALTPLLAAGAGLIAVVLGGVAWREPDFPPFRTVQTLPSYGMGNGLPAIQVGSIEASNARTRAWGDLLRHEMVDLFVRSSLVNAFPDTAASTASGRGEPDYRLTGIVYHGAQRIRVDMELIDAIGEVLWSQLWHSDAADPRLRQTVLSDVADALLLPGGVIRAREIAMYTASQISDPRRRCKVAADQALFSGVRAAFARPIHCMEKLTGADPSWALGLSYLSMLGSREHENGWEREGESGVVLARALAAARRAVELDPRSSYAHHALSIALFNLHVFSDSFAAAEQSMRLDPYDLFTVGDYGGRLVRLGELDRGMELLHRLESTMAVWSCNQRSYLLLAHYLRGETSEVIKQGQQLTTDSCPISFVATALAALTAADGSLARERIEQLKVCAPLWREHPAQALSRIFPNHALADRVGADLARAGLEP